MFKYINQRLGVKLIGSVVASLLLFSVLLVSYITNDERKVLLEQSAEQGQVLAKVTALSIIEPLLMDDYPVIRSYTEMLFNSNRDIDFIKIVRDDGKLLSENIHITDQTNHTDDAVSVYEEGVR